MNSHLVYLIKGELQRLIKYHVHVVSLIVTFTWFVLLYFIDQPDLFNFLLPTIIGVDATIMSIMFIGSVLFFEKSEQTISSLLVCPIKKSDLILSKVISNVIHLTLSSLLVAIVFFFIRSIEMNFLSLLSGLIFSVFLHSLIGFVFSFVAKSFTSMLVLVMGYAFLFTLPTILKDLNIFFTNELFDYLFLLNPQYATNEILGSSLSNSFGVTYYMAFGFIALESFLLYQFVVLKHYKSNAVKQSGV